jgi:hypothetical protein
LDRGGEGGEALDEDFALDVAAAATAGHLGKELEGALAGAEIGEVEAKVGVDDADEGDIGEVEPFGDHLGADEDVDLADAEGAEGLAVGFAPLHHVGVHPADDRFGEELRHHVFHSLGARPAIFDAGIGAFRAFRGRHRIVAADAPRRVRPCLLTISDVCTLTVGQSSRGQLQKSEFHAFAIRKSDFGRRAAGQAVPSETASGTERSVRVQIDKIEFSAPRRGQFTVIPGHRFAGRPIFVSSARKSGPTGSVAVAANASRRAAAAS